MDQFFTRTYARQRRQKRAFKSISTRTTFSIHPQFSKDAALQIEKRATEDLRNAVRVQTVTASRGSEGFTLRESQRTGTAG